MGIEPLPVFLIITCFITTHPLHALMNDSTEEDSICYEHYDEPDQTTLNKKLFDTVLRLSKHDQCRLRIIDNLLEQGANPDAIINDTTQATALEYAFTHRDFELLRLFFNPEYIQNLSKLRQERTFLQRAIEDNDKEMICFLSAYQMQSKIDAKQSDACCISQKNSTFFNRLRSLLKI